VCTLYREGGHVVIFTIRISKVHIGYPLPVKVLIANYATRCMNRYGWTSNWNRQTIYREIQRTERAMHDANLREDIDRGIPRIEAIHWALNEIHVLRMKTNDWHWGKHNESILSNEQYSRRCLKMWRLISSVG